MDDTNSTTEDPIEKLALSIANGFAGMDKKFEEVHKRIDERAAEAEKTLRSEMASMKQDILDKVDERIGQAEVRLIQKLSSKEKVDDHEARLAKLEEQLA